jgi:hypothetical protein
MKKALLAALLVATPLLAADAARTVVDLQPYRQSESAAVTAPEGGKGTATLINLNPHINAWFLLRLDRTGGEEAAYHLENPDPKRQSLHLAAAGLRIASGGGQRDCPLWAQLDAAQRSGLPYAPFCDGHVFLRNRVAGKFTALERTTEFLREHVWGSEAIISFVRKEFYRDSAIEKGAPAAGAAVAETHPDWPLPALVESGQAIAPTGLDIGLDRPVNRLTAGQWYPVKDLPGVYASFIQPKSIAPEILESYRKRVNALDAVEGSALDYFIAFDLARFDLGFAVGTNHPRVDWSDRPPVRDRGDRPGPDGIGTIAPLVGNGMISPAVAARAIATFAGGFKRQHGAFRYGALALRNNGSHYGFIEQGTVLSTLVPDLATVFVLDDGSIDMKTWTSADDALLPRIKFARQNGVPLIERDAATGVSAPGSLVNQWGPGNWSGTAEEKLRSLRAGLCLQATPSKRFLIYGYFSTATPSAMARGFQAYRCRYAMHLDMNAPELTYLALYVHEGTQLVVEHLVESMAQFDKSSDSTTIPRFLGSPDNRDFFYLLRRETTP